MATRHSLLFVAVMAFGCGSDPTGPQVQNDLVFEREDNTVIAFSGTARVWCGPWEPGEVAAQSVHVLVGNAQGGWKLMAVVDDITVGVPVTFPNTFIFDDPDGADLFILDPPNELSTQAEDSSGSITFTEIDCTAGGEVAFTIDAVIGSELGGQPTVSVTGSLSGGVGAAP